MKQLIFSENDLIFRKSAHRQVFKCQMDFPDLGSGRQFFFMDYTGVDQKNITRFDRETVIPKMIKAFTDQLIYDHDSRE